MGEKGRCAVVVNPVKVSETFADTLRKRLAVDGWAEPLWLETTEADPGVAMARQAVEARVDLVVAAGGDGTVRVVADVLAHTDIPLGVVPAGTGNLLARNLGLPLTEAEAIDVVLDGQTQQLDMIEVKADQESPQRSAVIAGMGVDAMIMDETRPDLKAKIGSAAYFIAAAKALGRLPMDLRVTVDGGRTHHRKAMICAIGNVGELPGNIVLIPGAAPDDGRLDVYLASPHRFTHWVRVLIRLVTRRGRRDDMVDQWTGERVEVRLRKPEPYQLDGDIAGECQTLIAEVDRAALLLRVPAA